MYSVKLPIWIRIVVVAGLVVLAAGASLFAYRWYTRPVTLSIAVGSLDGEAPKVVSALASRLAEINAPVRLNVVETAGAVQSAEAFASGKTASQSSAETLATCRTRKQWLSWPKRWRCLLHHRDRPLRTWPA